MVQSDFFHPTFYQPELKFLFIGISCPKLGLDFLLGHNNLSSFIMEKHVGFEDEWCWSCLALLLYFGTIPYKGTVCEDTAECQSILGLRLKVAVCINLTVGKEALVQQPLRSTPDGHGGFQFPGEVLLLN